MAKKKPAEAGCNHLNVRVPQALTRRLVDWLRSSIPVRSNAALEGSGMSSIVMFEKSIPLSGVLGVALDPKVAEFAQNASMPK